jgi:hypothetical protein
VRRSSDNKQWKNSERFRLQDNLQDTARKSVVMNVGNGNKGYSVEVYE